MNTAALLTTLFSDHKVTLPGTGREVSIKKVTIRTLKPVVDLLGRAIGDLGLTADGLSASSLTDPSVILKLISKYFDEVVLLSSVLSDVTSEEMYAMEPDDGVVLVSAIVALNRDFFMKKVMPSLGLARSMAVSEAPDTAA